MADPLVDLATVGDATTYLVNVNLTPPTNLDELVTAVSAIIQQDVNRRFPSQPYSVTLNGWGSDRVLLPNTPISAVSSLTIDGVAITAASSPTAYGYVFDDLAVYLRGYSFCRGVQNVAIAYTAGFATIPADLVQACVEGVGAVIATFQYADPRAIELQAGGTKLVFASGKPVDLKSICLTPNVTKIINQYRREAPMW